MVAWVVIDRQHLPRAARGPRQARKPCRLLASFPVLIPISHSSSPILLPTDRCPLTCPDRVGVTAHYCFKSFRCNTYRPPRKCCKQKTYALAKPFRCNTYKKQGGGVPVMVNQISDEEICPKEHRDEGPVFSLHRASRLQPLMRRRGARTDTENIGDRPGERIGVVFLERSLVAAEHLQLDCASMHVNLCFRPAFQVLSRHEPNACRQQFPIQVVHRERRPGENEQDPARIVLTQSGLAPFSQLLAPLVGARVFYQPQILHRGIVVLLDGFQGDSGSIQIKNAKA